MQKVQQARQAAEKARQKAIQEGRAAPPVPTEEEELEKLEQQLEEDDDDDYNPLTRVASKRLPTTNTHIHIYTRIPGRSHGGKPDSRRLRRA